MRTCTLLLSIILWAGTSAGGVLFPPPLPPGHWERDPSFGDYYYVPDEPGPTLTCGPYRGDDQAEIAPAIRNLLDLVRATPTRPATTPAMTPVDTSSKLPMLDLQDEVARRIAGLKQVADHIPTSGDTWPIFNVPDPGPSIVGNLLPQPQATGIIQLPGTDPPGIPWSPPPPPSPVSLPFQDGFENIEVGDYPRENGWKVLFDGKGTRAGAVTDVCARSGTRSFCLDSYGNWARMDYLYLDLIPDRLMYEVSIRVDPTYGHSALAGFMKGVNNEGPVWNYFWVSGDTGEVQFVGLDGTHVGEYTPGTWCTVRADLDFVNQKADLWMNGNLVVENVAIRPKEFDTDRYGHVVLDLWGVMSCNYSDGSDNVVYFDDVRLCETGR
ncbi:MAG: hypothetical protein JW955_23615 [Sedimentisphaerales bacterium]|nr:hypothetical protein [Sedimentisphaerales bacterium]